MKTNSRSAFFCTLILGTLLASACRSSRTHSDARDNGSFRTLLYGYQSGLKPGTIHVARNEKEWNELWSEHTAHMMPRPPEPSVDWKNEMLVCIALGERPTAGYAIEIESIEHEGGRLVVEAVEKKPAPGAIEPQVITHPYVIAATARSTDSVELEMK